MSKALLKIAKIMPRLTTPNMNEKIICIEMIERIMASEQITWVDAGLQLEAWLTDILGYTPPPEAPPVAKPQSGWTAAAPAPRSGPFRPAPFPGAAASSVNPPGWGASATPGAAASPPPQPAAKPPKRADPRAYGTPSDKLVLTRELLSKARAISLTPREKQNLQAIEALLSMGLSISPKQGNTLAELSKKL